MDNDFFIEENGSHWNQDAIILGLDARPSRLSAFNKGEGRGRDWIAYLHTFKKENAVYDASNLPTKVITTSSINGTGATMEIAFPLEYIKKMGGVSWSQLRFGIGYYDYDKNDESPTSHFWFPSWSGGQDIPGSGILFRE